MLRARCNDSIHWNDAVENIIDIRADYSLDFKGFTNFRN